MRARELTRVEVLARVKAGALSVRAAAVLLQVGTVRRSGWCAAIEHGARKVCGMAVPGVGPITHGRRRSAVERNHGTHQDRLVKTLRRAGIVDATTAWRNEGFRCK